MESRKMVLMNLFSGQQWRNRPREKYYGRRGEESVKKTSKQSIDIHTKFYFWTLNCLPLIYVSIFVLVTHCFDYHRFSASFQIRRCKSSSYVLLFQDCLFSTLGPLHFHMNFRITLSFLPPKKPAITLIGI